MQRAPVKFFKLSMFWRSNDTELFIPNRRTKTIFSERALVGRAGFAEKELVPWKPAECLSQTLTHLSMVVFLGGPLRWPIKVISIVFLLNIQLREFSFLLLNHRYKAVINLLNKFPLNHLCDCTQPLKSQLSLWLAHLPENHWSGRM